MPKLKNTLLLLLALMVGWPIYASSVIAGTIDPKLEAHLATVAPDAEVRIIVRMRDSSGQSEARERFRDRRAARNERRQSHRDLKEAFRQRRTHRQTLMRRHRIRPTRSRGRDNSTLRDGRTQKRLWLINGIAVAANSESIYSLSKDRGISGIYLDEVITLTDSTRVADAVPGWNLTAIGADTLWSAGHLGAGVVVATMDSGVDVQHPDLASSWRGGTNSWIDLTDPLQLIPRDASGHGTQVMGLILGGDASGNAIGVAPGATWIAARIFDDQGQASLSDIHLAFEWLLDPDGNPSTDDAPHVLNASWGLLNSLGGCNSEFTQDIEALTAAEISVVFAAGNSGPSPNTDLSPANGAEGLSVGSLQSDLNIMMASSRGPSACTAAVFPHLTAPGVAVLTTDLSFGGWAFYTQASGTSVAAPHVSGSIALLRGAHPTATVAEIEAALLESALDLGDLGPDNSYGYGLMDVASALQWLEDGPLCADASTAPDSDSDGIPDDCDNCLLFQNTAQIDTDQDGYGNRCDADFDNDGSVTMSDITHFLTLFNTNSPAADFNGDGYVNFFEVFVIVNSYSKAPGPSGILP